MVCHVAQSTQAEQATNDRRSFVPNVDIVEVDGNVEIYVDLPGATQESIDVHVGEGKLTIDAEVPERSAENAQYLLREYGVGDFHRSFRVGKGVDTARTEATYANGVLVVKLPRSEESKPRRINVQV